MNCSPLLPVLVYLLLTLLLLTSPPGTSSYDIKIPREYVALEGDLKVEVIFSKQETENRSNVLDVETDNNSRNDNDIDSDKKDNEATTPSPSFKENQIDTYVDTLWKTDPSDEYNDRKYDSSSRFNGKHLSEKVKTVSKNNKLSFVKNSHWDFPSGSSRRWNNDIMSIINQTRLFVPSNNFNSRISRSPSALVLSLHSLDSKKLLKKFTVPIDESQTKFAFSCGTIVHGGHYVLRLNRGWTILAESQLLNVSWPQLVIETPVRLETYRSPADIEISFTKAHHCLSTDLGEFKTWAELLYHGAEYEAPAPTRLPTSVLRQVQVDTEERRSKRSDFLPLLPQKQSNPNSHRQKEGELNSKKQRNSQTRKRFILSSLQGSTILSKSNSNIKPEPLTKRDQDLSQGFRVMQRVPIEGKLYSKGKHRVRFNCEVIGPAGKYSVRIITDVASNPVIVHSDTFLVEWAENFNLNVPRTNLIPCSVPVPVTYTKPLCVGKQEKIRLYAQVRANVSSANPPIYPRYLTERRASNRSTSFDCRHFTTEPTEYCFVYVNYASSGAVSDVRTQCVATYKPDVIRIDGQWGRWSNWSDCTTTCGAGVRIKHRFCDSPPPRNGGLFCQGSSLMNEPCGDASCVPPLPEAIPSSAFPSLVDDNECLCGCTVALIKKFDFTIAPSAADCVGVSTWTIESPPGTIVGAELVRAALLGGSQWLKVRDGSDRAAPLLLSLPSFRSMTTGDTIPLRLTSSESLLSISFSSDVNTSFIGNVWGFSMRFNAITPQPRHLESSPVVEPTTGYLSAFHITVIVMGVYVLVAITFYLAYFCKRYPAYKKSLLVVDDSPLETPEDSPMHQRPKTLITSADSITTLTEVISLKSLKFGVRKNNTSYTRLVKEGDIRKGILRSLPSSPMLSSGRFPFIRRSTSQLLRKMKKGNTNRKRQNRRSASFDQLRTDISPIYEDPPPLPSSQTMENLNNKTDCYKELKNGKGESNSDKYREYRKSLVASKAIFESMNHDSSKLSKDRMNQKLHHVKLRKDALSSSSGEGGVRTSSSLSELSVTSGIDIEMEYDYYDYDVGNASAAPGSLFGIDPTLMPWMIDIDELDIKTPEQLGATRSIDSCALMSPLKSENVGEEIPMKNLNIPLLQQSSTSNESNESNDTTPRPYHSMGTEEVDDADLTPRVENKFMPQEPSEQIKILNIHDVEDFQFADDSDDD